MSDSAKDMLVSKAERENAETLPLVVGAVVDVIVADVSRYVMPVLLPLTAQVGMLRKHR